MVKNDVEISNEKREKASCFVQYRAFPGDHKLFQKLIIMEHRGEISEAEVVRRMKAAEAEYHGVIPQLEGNGRGPLTEVDDGK